MRKHRSDAKIYSSLTEEQQDELYSLLKSGLSYEKAVRYCQKTFNLFTSFGALHNFWTTRSRQEAAARTMKAVAASSAFLGEAEEAIPNLERANTAQLHQAAFEAFQLGDVEQIKTFYTLILKAQAQDVDKNQASLAREKFEFDAAKAVLAGLEELKAIRGSSMNASDQIMAVRRKLFSVVPDA